MNIGARTWSDLPGEVVVQEADDVIYGTRGYRVLHTLGRYKYGAHTAVSLAFLEDVSPEAVEQHVVYQLDRFIRPWAYADRIRWPHFEPFPRLERWRHKLSQPRRKL